MGGKASFHLEYPLVLSRFCFVLVCEVCLPRINHEVSEETNLGIWNNSQLCVIHHYGQDIQIQIGDIRKLKYVKHKYGSYTA